MWVVEVNILGRRFTRRVGDHPAVQRLRPQNIQMLLSQLRHPRAAV